MNYRHVNPINSFYEIDSYDFIRKLSEKIQNEIEGKGKEYILGVDEEDFKNYLIEKYTLEPLNVDFGSETIGQPSVSKECPYADGRRGKYQAEVYTFTVTYKFTGSAVLFKVKPKTCTMTTTEIYVNEQRGTVSFSFKLYKRDPKEFNSGKNLFRDRAFTNMDNTNSVALDWNNKLPGIVNSYFHSQKEKYQKENDFFAEGNGVKSRHLTFKKNK